MRHTHKIAKHVYLRRAGLQELSFSTKEVSLDGVGLEFPGFSVYQSVDCHAVGHRQQAWHEPNHGAAVRTPPLKQAKTSRGHIFHNDLVVYHESELEHRVSTVLRTYRGLERLVSQYPKVQYPDEDGIMREHTFDYFVEMSDETRIAIAVKYDRKRSEMRDFLERIRVNEITGVSKGGKTQPWVADAVLLITNVEATQDAYENAFFVLSSRNHHDEAQCTVLRDLVQRMPGTFRFGQLLLRCGPRAKRRTAIWRLIDLGILEAVFPGRIDELSWLRAA